MQPAFPIVALVLPPAEGFSPGRTGAVGLVAQRLAAAGAGGPFAPVVIGAPGAAPPFADVRFRAALPPWWLPGNRTRRHAAGVVHVLRRVRPALIEVHNRPEIALILASRFPAVPVVLVLHNDPHGMRGARRPSERAALLDRLAAVVTVSDFLRARLLEGVAAPARPPVVLANGIDLAQVPPPPAARERLILFTGRIVADKGADDFVTACTTALPRLPGWRAAMIGADRFRADSPDTRFIRALRPRAQAAGIAMPGYLPHAAVLEALSRSAIAVVPSRWPEPFGLAALEAMACGAALICTPQGGLPEVVGEAATLVPPGAPDALARAIEALAGDPDRRAALGEAGLAQARLFDLPGRAAAWTALRRRLLGG